MWIFRPTTPLLVAKLKPSKELFVAAPWASPTPVRALIESCSAKTSIEFWFRMNPGETPFNQMLQVLKLLSNRTAIKIARHAGLHWKAYLTPSVGYVGSANCTDTGLPQNKSTSLEALMRLTKAQLREAHGLRNSFAKEMDYFKDVPSAMKWWREQPHPDELGTPPAEVTTPVKIKAPRGFMR